MVLILCHNIVLGVKFARKNFIYNYKCSRKSEVKKKQKKVHTHIENKGGNLDKGKSNRYRGLCYDGREFIRVDLRCLRQFGVIEQQSKRYKSTTKCVNNESNSIPVELSGDVRNVWNVTICSQLSSTVQFISCTNPTI